MCSSLLLEQLSEGPGAQLEIHPKFEPQAADEDVEGESSILFIIARLGSAWVMALVLSVVFGEGDVRFDVNNADAQGNAPLLMA